MPIISVLWIIFLLMRWQFSANCFKIFWVYAIPYFWANHDMTSIFLLNKVWAKIDSQRSKLDFSYAQSPPRKTQNPFRKPQIDSQRPKIELQWVKIDFRRLKINSQRPNTDFLNKKLDSLTSRSQYSTPTGSQMNQQPKIDRPRSNLLPDS